MKKLLVPLALILSISGCFNSNTEVEKEHQGELKQNKQVVSLSPVANEGKALFKTCDACHSQENNPSKAPPMIAVKKHYGERYTDKESFVKAVVAFVSSPSEEKALLKRPIKRFGLMPALPLGDESLTKIATYIYENQFPKPCKHWRVVIENAEKAGKMDDHIKKDKMKYERFCK